MLMAQYDSIITIAAKLLALREQVFQPKRPVI
jgi:hypothetical protein